MLMEFLLMIPLIGILSWLYVYLRCLCIRSAVLAKQSPSSVSPILETPQQQPDMQSGRVQSCCKLGHVLFSHL